MFFINVETLGVPHTTDLDSDYNHRRLHRSFGTTDPPSGLYLNKAASAYNSGSYNTGAGRLSL